MALAYLKSASLQIDILWLALDQGQRLAVQLHGFYLILPQMQLHFIAALGQAAFKTSFCGLNGYQNVSAQRFLAQTGAGQGAVQIVGT